MLVIHGIWAYGALSLWITSMANTPATAWTNHSAR